MPQSTSTCSSSAITRGRDPVTVPAPPWNPIRSMVGPLYHPLREVLRFRAVVGFTSMSLNLATIVRESARSGPDRTALIAGNARISHRDLDEKARRLAAGLLKAGVKRGQHVALLLPNTPHFTIAYFAVHYAGAAVVPLNVLFKADEIAYHLNDSDAVALIAWDEFLGEARPGFERADSCR